MGNSQLVQRPGPNVQASANSYYSATSAGKHSLLIYDFIYGKYSINKFKIIYIHIHIYIYIIFVTN